MSRQARSKACVSERALEAELSSTLNQAVSHFLNLAQVPVVGKNEIEKADIVFLDPHLVREFSLYLIRELNEFIHRPENIAILPPERKRR